MSSDRFDGPWNRFDLIKIGIGVRYRSGELRVLVDFVLL